MFRSVTSASGDTKAIAGTQDGQRRSRRRGLGAGPSVQLSRPSPGSAWLRTAEGGGAETEKAMTRVCPRGEGTRPGSLPRPRRDPQTETQQGRYATAPPHGPGKRVRGLGPPAGGGVPETRPRGPPPPPSGPGHSRGPHSPAGLLRGGRSLPAAPRRRPRTGPGSREAPRQAVREVGRRARPPHRPCCAAQGRTRRSQGGDR